MQRAPQPQAGGQRGPQPTGQSVLQPVTVSEIVTEDVVTAEPNTPLRTVVAMMDDQDVGSVIVVEDDTPIGIITDREVALSLEETPDITDLTADDLVEDDVVTIDTSTTILDALSEMSDEGIRRLPVIDEDGNLQGIVTFDDTVVFTAGELGQLAAVVQSQAIHS